MREVLAVLCEEAEAGRGFLLPGAENGLTVGCRLVGAEYGRLVAIDCESFQKCRLSMSKLDLRYVIVLDYVRLLRYVKLDNEVIVDILRV